MKTAIFTNRLDIVERIKPTWDVEEIEQTPMLFSASVDFARKNGGELTNMVLDVIEKEIVAAQAVSIKPYHIVIDTKTVMLMRGMIPSIPGWHGDAVPRSAKYAQPDPEQIDESLKHWVVNVSSNEMGVSNTEFMNKPLTVLYDEKRVWGSIDKYIRESENQSELPIYSSNDGEIVKFQQNTLHRAVPCENPGWRWFFRASMYPRKPMNKIRHQVQVYADPSVGW